MKKKKLVLTGLILILGCCLTSCAGVFTDRASTTQAHADLDLCRAGILPFTPTDAEILAMGREMRINMASVNCELYKQCGFMIRHPEMCP